MFPQLNLLSHLCVQLLLSLPLFHVEPQGYLIVTQAIIGRGGILLLSMGRKGRPLLLSMGRKGRPLLISIGRKGWPLVSSMGRKGRALLISRKKDLLC